MDGLIFVLAVVGVFVLVLWILLPFTVFSIKDKLDQLIALQEKTHALMQKQLKPPQSDE